MISLEKMLRVPGRLLSFSVVVAALCLSLLAVGDVHPEKASGDNNVKKAQESLHNKGYYSGNVDGIMGPQTRAALREYQKVEKLEVTGRLDTKTAGKLGVGPESVGGNFKAAGKEVEEGTEEAGHEMKEGKPAAASKEMGKGMGRMGKDVGKGMKKALDPDSDRGDREEQRNEKK